MSHIQFSSIKLVDEIRAIAAANWTRAVATLVYFTLVIYSASMLFCWPRCRRDPDLGSSRTFRKHPAIADLDGVPHTLQLLRYKLHDVLAL